MNDINRDLMGAAFALGVAYCEDQLVPTLARDTIDAMLRQLKAAGRLSVDFDLVIDQDEMAAVTDQRDYLQTVANGDLTPVLEEFPSGPQRRELQKSFVDAAKVLVGIIDEATE